MPAALQMLPISLAKLILTACQQLLAYLTASAVRIGTTCRRDRQMVVERRQPVDRYRVAVERAEDDRARDRSSRWIAVLSRRNSG